MRGTKLQFLSLTDLRAFEIELPPRVQRRIARVHALKERVSSWSRSCGRHASNTSTHGDNGSAPWCLPFIPERT
jgi:hypothetical protein